MAQTATNGGWVEEASGSSPAATAKRGPDLARFSGVTELAQADVPADLAAHTQSDWYQVRGYYQLDDVARWRAWKRIRDQAGRQELWLFYACPFSMIEAVLKENAVLPYGDFFPKVFGREAIYFFAEPTPAARAALKFGVEPAGFLISCRVVTGKVFRTRRGNPQAGQAPPGYETVMAPQGTDLGSGPTAGDIYATFDPDRALMRYVTHVAWPDGG